MKEFKGTKDWKLGKDYDFAGDPVYYIDTRVCDFLMEIDNASEFDEDDCHDYEKIEANAKLIAAAPDMLKALTTVLHYFEHNSDKLIAHLEILKAINKAI